MSKDPKPSPELQDCIQTLRSILREQVQLIDVLIAVVSGDKPPASIRPETETIDPPVSSVIGLMLQGVGASSHALLILSEKVGTHTRDCYSVARGIVEGAINICYIIGEGAEAAELAVRHAKQKSFRDLDRRSQIGKSVITVAYSNRPDPSTIEGLKRDLDHFTSKAGREKRDWIELSVDDRIAAVGRRSGDAIATTLHGARFGVYRHSSEIIHATLFGTAFILGLTLPSGLPASGQKLAEHIGQLLMQILVSVILAIQGVCEAFHKRYGFASAYNRCDTLVRRVYEIPYLDLKRS